MHACCNPRRSRTAAARLGRCAPAATHFDTDSLGFEDRGMITRPFARALVQLAALPFLFCGVAACKRDGSTSTSDADAAANVAAAATSASASATPSASAAAKGPHAASAQPGKCKRGMCNLGKELLRHAGRRRASVREPRERREDAVLLRRRSRLAHRDGVQPVHLLRRRQEVLQAPRRRPCRDDSGRVRRHVRDRRGVRADRVARAKAGRRAKPTSTSAPAASAPAAPSPRGTTNARRAHRRGRKVYVASCARAIQRCA